MPRSPFQNTLRARANALRSIDVAKRRIAALEARVAELDAQIAAAGGARTLKPRLPFRANGEMQRAAFDLIRERGAITSADLAQRLRPDLEGPEAWAMRQRSIQALKRLERRGLVKHVAGVGKGARFKKFNLSEDLER